MIYIYIYIVLDLFHLMAFKQSHKPIKIPPEDVDCFFLLVSEYSLRPRKNQFLKSVLKSLTNFIEKSNNIYDIKCASYKNIFYDKSNDTNLIP